MPKAKQKLWIISELFYPEQTSTGYFLTEIARGLADEFDVHVVCGQPTYSERGIRAPKREKWNGISIFRLASTSFNKDKLSLRLINAFTLTLSAIFYLIWNVKSDDRILVVTNPPVLTPVVALIGKLKSSQQYLLVHDVYPEILVATGFLKAGSLAYRVLDYIISLAFNAFDKIVVLGADMKEVVAHKISEGRVEIVTIPNWGDHEEIVPVEPSENRFMAEHGLHSKKTIIQFSGNIGRTHDIESILAAADATRESREILFLFSGYGGKVPLLRDRLKIQNLDNVTFVDRQPRELLAAMLSSATAVVISFNDKMFGLSVPSRMYNVLSAGTPIIAMAHPKSELATMVSQHEAGWVVAAHDKDALTALVNYLATDAGRAEAERRGARGRRAVQEHFTLKKVLESYANLLRGS